MRFTDRRKRRLADDCYDEVYLSPNRGKVWIMAILHLAILGQEQLAVEGRYGCDYAWNDDFTAYRCMPHRWNPNSDESYIEWAYGCNDSEFGEPCRGETGGNLLPPMPIETPSEPDDGVPF